MPAATAASLRRALGSAFVVIVIGAAGCSAALPTVRNSNELSPKPDASEGLIRDLRDQLPADGTYFERLAVCLREAGWSAEASEDGESMTFDYFEESNRAEYERDKRICDVVVGQPPPPEPLTESEIRAVYDYWVLMRDCIAEMGYLTSEPPTHDEFIRSWDAEDPWSPYLDIPPHAFDRVEARCPQSPPGQEP
jgi:hypothetical protein